MKWTKKYLVMSDERIYIHGHKRVGFDSPKELMITPNTMLYSTTLKTHSFEVVLFSESLHLAASTDTEKTEWMFLIQQVIPCSHYDFNDPLQAASFERKLNDFDVQFESEKQPGVILERRGNWALAAVVSDQLSRKVSQGSMLSYVGGQSVALTGFDSVVSKLSLWNSPLNLTFWLSPQKMGWLTMKDTIKGKGWAASKVVTWGKVKVVYLATLTSSTRLMLFFNTFFHRASVCNSFHWVVISLHSS
jgi:hypothetical protein